MKQMLVALFLITTISGLSQTRYQLYIDSIGMAMSNYIDAHKEHLDSSNFVSYLNNIADQYQGAKDSISIQEKKDLPVQLLIRVLHHNNYLADKFYQKIPKSKYWTYSKEMPASSISQEDCASFWTHTSFIYHDSDTSIVRLTLNKNYWLDTMADNSYSKLAVEKLNDQTFNSKFIESNNRFKSLLSIPGDIYCYQLLEKKEHSYMISTHMNGLSNYFVFELEY